MSANQSQHRQDILRGIAYGCTAFFLFAVMNATAKLLTGTHSIFEISFYRSLIALLPFAAYMVIRNRYDLLHVKKPRMLLTRVVIGIAGLTFTFGAYKYMPMADATLIFMAATLITPALAFFFLGERMGWRRWAAIMFGLSGVFFVLQPTGDGLWIGAILSGLAACTHSIVQVMLRALREENSFTITFYFLLGGVILMAPFMPFTAIGFDNMNDIWLMIAVGVSGALAQLTMAYAFTLAPASSVSPFNLTGLLWATMFDIAIWSYIPGWPVFMGSAMIICAKIYILHREKVNASKAMANDHE